MPDPQSLFFCLGGHDLEMRTIAELVGTSLGREHVIDRGFGWGARAAGYAADMAAILAKGGTPVLVELDTAGAELPGGAIVVDHHGMAAGADCPSSLEQVFLLLGLPRECWTRELALVAANDVGHVAALRAMGADEDEIRRIRAADRAAQGVSAAQERQAEEALARAETVCGGRVLLVRLPHERTAPVMDLLALVGDAPGTVVIVSPSEINVFGPGAVVAALNSAVPGGWSGGALPERGFWGCHGRDREGEVLSVVSRLDLHMTR